MLVFRVIVCFRCVYGESCHYQLLIASHDIVGMMFRAGSLFVRVNMFGVMCVALAHGSVALKRRKAYTLSRDGTCFVWKWHRFTQEEYPNESTEIERGRGAQGYWRLEKRHSFDQARVRRRIHLGFIAPRYRSLSHLRRLQWLTLSLFLSVPA